MKDKKQLLFVIPSLDAGGAEKSLVNLLHELAKEEQVNIDLVLFQKKGLFLTLLPPNVSVIEVTNPLLNKSFSSFLKAGKFCLIYHRLMQSLNYKKMANLAIAEQRSWKHYCHFLKPIVQKEYDVAIAYLEKSSTYYVVDKVAAKKKIAWIHTDYKKSNQDPNFDGSYFEQLDQIITISETCNKSLQESFPKLHEKFLLLQNLSSPNLIQQLSKKSLNLPVDEAQFVLLTIGRLSYEKGIDLAIEAAYILKKQNVNFKWWIIGEGKERNALEQLIEQYELKDDVTLLGLKENPYPYLKRANVYVQPSRHEGRSIAIDEAMILQRNIIVTNYPSAKDQIEHGENGFIVAMNPEAIAAAIIERKDLIMEGNQYLNDLGFHFQQQYIDYKKLIGIEQ